MTISRKYLLVVVCLLFVNQTVIADAQVINASLPDASPGAEPAAGSAEVEPGSHGILPASWPSIPMPTITMPKITMPKWPTHADGTYVSPFAPITAGAKMVSTGTRKMWEGTKSIFTFDSQQQTSQPHLPNQNQKPSFWQRVTGQEPEPSGPQTVAEWMSQPRLNP
jgi:hypothetical protein